MGPQQGMRLNNRTKCKQEPERERERSKWFNTKEEEKKRYPKLSSRICISKASAQNGCRKNNKSPTGCKEETTGTKAEAVCKNGICESTRPMAQKLKHSGAWHWHPKFLQTRTLNHLNRSRGLTKEKEIRALYQFKHDIANSSISSILNYFHQSILLCGTSLQVFPWIHGQLDTHKPRSLLYKFKVNLEHHLHKNFKQASIPTWSVHVLFHPWFI